MPSTTRKPTFLLVHGGYHRAATWSLLQKELAAGGWESEAIDMSSAGERPTAGLYDDAEELAEHIRGMEGPVIVLGHSHGGLTISELDDDHPNILRLVYLAAFMPREGQSAAGILGITVTESDGSLAPPIADPRTALYGDLPDDEAAIAVGRLVNQSLRSGIEPTTRAAWRRMASTYIVCDHDQLFPVSLQEEYAAQATSVEHLPTGHSPFLSAPGQLAALLIQIAEAACRETERL